mmetsp:Transcript_95461/g.132611  ORF Transcript_95461/g.132611 Transcript_95461/m.132611 type:complete len:105 (+) Transcript_95461:3-317(+)
MALIEGVGAVEQEMVGPTDAQRAKHKSDCTSLMISEGTTGMFRYGITAIALLAAGHYMARPGSMWRTFRPKAWVFAASLAAGFAIPAELAGLECARNPPWVPKQ